jgi:hypothetical protein
VMANRAPDDDHAFTPEKSSWRETRAFHPRDCTLRRMGWRIEGRPNKGPVTWRKGDLVATECEALAMIDAAATRRQEPHESLPMGKRQ